MSGIEIAGDGKGAVINGIRCGVVSEMALDIVTERYAQGSYIELTGAELDIAVKAARFLVKMRCAGYSKEATRAAFVRKIVDEAQRVSAPVVESSTERTDPGLLSRCHVKVLDLPAEPSTTEQE